MSSALMGAVTEDAPLHAPFPLSLQLNLLHSVTDRVTDFPSSCFQGEVTSAGTSYCLEEGPESWSPAPQGREVFLLVRGMTADITTLC